MLSVLVLGPFYPLVAQAQTSFPLNAGQDTGFTNPAPLSSTPAVPTTPSADTSTSVNGFNLNGTYTAPTSATGATLPASAANATNQNPPNDPTGCSSSVPLCLSSIVYIFTVGIGSAFAYVAATFFNLAINLSLNGPIYALTFISTGWTTARDLANMAFLFVLIYIAFMLIFQAETSNTMSLLAGVIIIALLVNFSFFFTRLAIDVGNILSIQFYNSINAPSVAASSGTGGVASFASQTVNTVTNATAGITGTNTKDLTASIMGMLNLQGLFNTNSFQNFTKTNDSVSQFITLCFLYIGAAIMFWLLTVTFVTAGIKFLVRIVVLWFLIIASPLAFVARAIPKFRGYFDKWLGMLISHSFYPVAFMFIFLILTNFTNQMGGPNSSSNFINNLFNNLSTTSASNVGGITSLGLLIANVAISMGFIVIILYMALKVSDNISVVGGKAAESAGKWVGGKMIGTYGAIGRQTSGRVFNALSQSPGLANKANQGGITGSLWSGARSVTKKLGSATYDIRNAPGASALGKALSIDTGKAATEGYTQQVKAKEKKEKEEKAERAAIIRDAANQEALKRIDADIRAGRPHAQADVDRVRNLNKRELEVRSATEIQNIAHLLTEGQHKIVQDSSEYTDDEKDKIRKIADPNIKSQKIVIDELRKLNNNLITVRSAVVATGTARGAVVNPISTAAMSADLNTQFATLRANLTAATNLGAAGAGQAEDIKSDLTQIRGAVNSLRNLSRNLNNVPAQGARNPQEIIAH